MKLYQIRAKKGKLKYSDEHIHFRLDGTEKYNWRKVLSEIISLNDLSLPKELEFDVEKINYKRLNDYPWLKSSFLLPIISKQFLSLISDQVQQNKEYYPIKIFNGKEVSEDFAAFYLKETLDCLDTSLTKKIVVSGVEQYDFKNGIYKENIDYPLIFKIKELRLSHTHYCTEYGRKVLMDFSENGFDFYDLHDINMS